MCADCVTVGYFYGMQPSYLESLVDDLLCDDPLWPNLKQHPGMGLIKLYRKPGYYIARADTLPAPSFSPFGRLYFSLISLPLPDLTAVGQFWRP